MKYQTVNIYCEKQLSPSSRPQCFAQGFPETGLNSPTLLKGVNVLQARLCNRKGLLAPAPLPHAPVQTGVFQFLSRSTAWFPSPHADRTGGCCDRNLTAGWLRGLGPAKLEERGNPLGKGAHLYTQPAETT